MNWSDINVFQYQQIVKLIDGRVNEETTPKLVAICFNLTDNQVGDMSLEEYNQKVKELAFISEEITGDAKPFIKANGKMYQVVYDVRKIPAARYIETKTFQKDFIGNLHKVFASMVIPMKKSLFGYKSTKYDSMNHEDYANDILYASIQDVYPSVVFFYHVYRNWMEVSKGYLIQEMEKKQVPQAKKVVAGLMKSMDGNIAPKLLPTTKILKLQRLMNSLQSTS